MQFNIHLWVVCVCMRARVCNNIHITDGPTSFTHIYVYTRNSLATFTVQLKMKLNVCCICAELCRVITTFAWKITKCLLLNGSKWLILAIQQNTTTPAAAPRKCPWMDACVHTTGILACWYVLLWQQRQEHRISEAINKRTTHFVNANRWMHRQIHFELYLSRSLSLPLPKTFASANFICSTVTFYHNFDTRSECSSITHYPNVITAVKLSTIDLVFHLQTMLAPISPPPHTTHIFVDVVVIIIISLALRLETYFKRRRIHNGVTFVCK